MPRHGTWAVLALAAAIGLAREESATPPSPDAVFTGDFVTLDPSAPRARAIAVASGRITAIGSEADVLRTAGPHATRVAIPGVGLPGFADAHAHPMALGEQLEMLDFHGHSKAETLAAVAEAARSGGRDEWIHGSGWDEGHWQPSLFPTAAELDAAARGR